MNIAEILLIALGLSADAFAVAVCRSTDKHCASIQDILSAAAVFGGFQAVMPVIGMLAGKSFAEIVAAADHWIAFGLLAFIGGKTFFAAVFPENGTVRKPIGHDLKTLLAEAAATSIDALAAGTGFAFSSVSGSEKNMPPILMPAALIGIVTFAVCAAGGFIGKFTVKNAADSKGRKAETAAGIFGGLALIAVGTKILLEGLLQV